MVDADKVVIEVGKENIWGEHGVYGGEETAVLLKLLVGLLSAPALLSIVKQLCVNTYDLILWYDNKWPCRESEKWKLNIS